MTFTLAHISDLHLSPIIGFTPPHWNLKRGFGYANWRARRRVVHRTEVAGVMLADMRLQQPDHVAVTGDLVNLGLPAEFEAAARWLAEVGAPDRVSLVPGNHDVYVPLRRDAGIGRWRPYMTSDAWGIAQGGAVTGFPYVKRAGPVAIVGLCSGVPTPLFVAAGRLGAPQIEAAKAVLDRLGQAHIFRVVLIHHPAVPGQVPPRRALEDVVAFAAALDAVGAELVLHGHSHFDTVVRLSGGTTVVGVASGSAAVPHGREPRARYNLICLPDSAEGGPVTLRTRGLLDDGTVGEVSRQVIAPL